MAHYDPTACDENPGYPEHLDEPEEPEIPTAEVRADGDCYYWRGIDGKSGRAKEHRVAIAMADFEPLAITWEFGYDDTRGIFPFGPWQERGE